MAVRRITIRLYPTFAQDADMTAILRQQQQLYNACLQERIGAYKQGIHITGYDQQRSLTEIRKEDVEFRNVTRRWQILTIERLDRAYKAFFRRAKAGQTPGFPRFQSIRRFSGWSSLRGDGYRYQPKLNAKGQAFNGSLWMKNIGNVKCRSKARNIGGEVKQIDISRRAGRWYVSIAVAYDKIERTSGIKSVGLDWGVTDYATLAYADGTVVPIANDRLFQAQQQKAAERQRAASRSLRGKRSNRAKAKHLQIARAHGHLANQRKDRAHKLSAKLVAEHALIATEELKIANMTRSAKGTAEKPGKMVAQKAGLNREILDTAPGMLMNMLRVKAEEAGCVLEFINTRKVKPSQTCPKCWAKVKKTLTQRVHACSCGLTMSRDGAAALVMLLSSKTHQGWKPTSG
jgi:putative transposase